MNLMDKIRNYVDLIYNNGSLKSLLSGEDFYVLRFYLSKLNEDISKLNENSDPNSFDDVLDTIDDCIYYLSNIETLVIKSNYLLMELYDILLDEFIPEDFYDE